MKTCTACRTPKPLNAFNRRAASRDGHQPECRVCHRTRHQAAYYGDDEFRANVLSRVVENKRARFDREPAYKRAFNLWGSTKKRRRECVLPWVQITDFVAICAKAIKRGPTYELDHIVPIHHPLVCGLHVPWNLRVVLKTTNTKKRDAFVV